MTTPPPVLPASAWTPQDERALNFYAKSQPLEAWTQSAREAHRFAREILRQREEIEALKAALEISEKARQALRDGWTAKEIEIASFRAALVGRSPETPAP